MVSGVHDNIIMIALTKRYQLDVVCCFVFCVPDKTGRSVR